MSQAAASQPLVALLLLFLSPSPLFFSLPWMWVVDVIVVAIPGEGKEQINIGFRQCDMFESTGLTRFCIAIDVDNPMALHTPGTKRSQNPKTF